MYAGHTQVCRVVFSPNGCTKLARAEAAVLSFSYTIILMLIVPIVIVMTLDLIFYVKELLAQANYSSVLGVFWWDLSSSGTSVKLSDLLRRYTVITSEKFVFADSETFHRVKTLVEVATFLLIVSSHLLPKSSFSPLKKPPMAANNRGRIKNSANTKNTTNNQPVDSNPSHLQFKSSHQKSRDGTDAALLYPNVCSLCGMSKSSPRLKNSTAAIKRVSFVTKHKALSSPSFWDSFQFLWSSVLHRSMRMIEGLPVVQMLKYHKLNASIWLSPVGLGQSSLFTAKAASILRSTSRLPNPNKRRWVKMMGRSQ